MNLYTATITLFFVMNPLGNIPVFITELKYFDPQKRTKIIARESIFALLILTLFLFAGRFVLEGIHVTESALSVAGGIVLFLIAIRLIFPTPKEKNAESKIEEPFLVPLAIPLFAGPAAMTMVMVLAEQPGKITSTLIALVISWLLSAIILLSSNTISNILGRRGLIAMERLMGMVLTTIAVQMLLTGISGYLHTM